MRIKPGTMHNLGTDIESVSLIALVVVGLLNRMDIITIEEPIGMIVGFLFIYIIGMTIRRIFPYNEDNPSISARAIRKVLHNNLTKRLYFCIRRNYNKTNADTEHLKDSAILFLVCACMGLFASGGILLGDMDLLDAIIGFAFTFSLSIVSIVGLLATLDEIIFRLKNNL